MRHNNQIIIAIEGIDGAGKTTIIDKLVNMIDDVVVYQRTKKNKFVDMLVSSKFLKKHYILQVPIYLLLSYKNYILFKMKPKKRIVIMDRCFLSNICYFIPKALDNKILLKLALMFEIKIFPKSIFILNVDPAVGCYRDKNKKTIEWLEKTQRAYLHSEKSVLLKWISIKVIDPETNTDEICNIILKNIKENYNGY